MPSKVHTFTLYSVSAACRHLEKEVYEMKIELESEKRNCFVLTEEKRQVLLYMSFMCIIELARQ